MFMRNFFNIDYYRNDGTAYVNAINFHSSITNFECVALSLDVYGGDNRPELPPRWTRFKSHSSISGYHGVCYVRDVDAEQPTCIVFAHRGTTNFTNLISDLQIALEWIPMGAAAIHTLIEKVKKKFLKKYETEEVAHKKLGNVPIISTGHSLGAILSNLMITMTYIPSFTYENPGAKNAMITFAKKNNISELDIQGWLQRFSGFSQVDQAGINFINSCHEQFTSNILRRPIEYSYNGLKDLTINPHYLLNQYYIMDHTLDQHPIERMYHHIKTRNTTSASEHPWGLKAAYAYYLKPSHEDYWRGYAQRLWQIYNDSLIKEYSYYNAYEKFFMSNLQKTWEEAKSIIDKKDMIISDSRYSLFSASYNDDINGDRTVLNSDQEKTNTVSSTLDTKCVII